MTFWNVFFGVFAGIIAGISINIGIDLIKNFRIQKRTRSNLKFEIDFNIGKINLFLKEIQNYRNQVNGDSLFNYFGYFHLSKVIITTVVQIFLDRSVYKYFNHEEIAKLQDFMLNFSTGSEQFMNNQIRGNRENYDKPGVKQSAIRDIDFWEKMFEMKKDDLQSIKDKL